MKYLLKISSYLQKHTVVTTTRHLQTAQMYNKKKHIKGYLLMSKERNQLLFLNISMTKLRCDENNTIR